MKQSLKRIFTIACFIGIFISSYSFGNTESLLTKVYNLAFQNNTTNSTALVYNGEIYINLTDLSTTTGLNATISDKAIQFSTSAPSSGTNLDNDGNLYEGAIKNGLPHGIGTRYLKEGGKYEGEWVNGLYEGQGTLVLPNGNIYVGHFSKGFIHGQGKMFYPDGSYYKGNYIYGIQDGFGLLYIDKDNKYEGYWENGLRNGKGKAYIDGRYKKGLWENNLMLKTLPESSFDF